MLTRVSEKWESGNKESMDVFDDPNFQNWGRTVKEEPSIVCFPKTRKGVQNIVKYAAKTNKRVRCSGTHRRTRGFLSLSLSC